jgi:hypothetical protein
MTLVVITALLFAVAIGSYIWGAYKLSEYAFRINQTKGLLVLLCPPYTFYFAFAELNEAGKETPTASAAFGLLATALLTLIFWTPITLVFTGQMSKLTPPKENVAESMEDKDESESQDEEQKAEDQKKEESSEEDKGADAGSTADTSPGSNNDEGTESEDNEDGDNE